MFYGYGLLSNHTPTLKSTVFRNNSTSNNSTLNTGLYAYYKAESNANDALSGFNGTAIGGVTYTAGKSGDAFTCNGTSGYVDLGNNIFNSFTSDFSVSAWINLNTVSGDQAIISSLSYSPGFGLANGWWLLTSSDTISFRIYRSDSGGQNTILSTATVLSTSTWYNIVVTRKAGTRTRIYVNGTEVASNSSTMNPTYTLGGTSESAIPSSIGTWKYTSTLKNDYLNGKIDELGVWNKELTASEVTELQTKFQPF
ncbi:Concanavalin A-like lectin/glucanases superfamily [uncultured Caudovirales phage]|uniref:Concanavalin A-like lectin/glucanases superfamily n=1 Tax=uncultured Caudovirales phage TaxID=2100421 RepID=A0A6J7WIV1_9CAUD|nr:Concanavalin A-like lectin/glucanases superfamily [uncultured Caudovirales phage]